jgi:hypothetical protein
MADGNGNGEGGDGGSNSQNQEGRNEGRGNVTGRRVKRGGFQLRNLGDGDVFLWNTGTVLPKNLE